MNDKISTLIDLEGDAADRQEMLNRIQDDSRAHDLWHRYHLIGGVIRGEVEIAGNDLSARIRDQLDHEPTVLAPLEKPRGTGVLADIWKSAGMLALAASIALMAVVTLKPVEEPANAGDRIASSNSENDVLSPEARGVFEQEIGEMLVEHGEFTASAGLNGLIAYAKLVSNEPIGR